MEDKAEASKGGDILRQISNVLFAIAQIVAGFYVTASKLGPSVQSQVMASNTPVTPAGYAFGIWGPIFILSLFYALYQALPSQRTNKLFRTIGYYTAGAFLMNALWETVVQVLGFNWLSVPIIVFDLVCSIVALYLYSKYHKLDRKIDPLEMALVYAPIAMQAGWISAATFVNISAVLSQAPTNNLGISMTAMSIIILILTSLTASAVICRTRHNIIYFVTVAWAFTAIMFANISSTGDQTVFCVTLGLMVFLLIRFIQSRALYARM